jgi:hypothetical protein
MNYLRDFSKGILNFAADFCCSLSKASIMFLLSKVYIPTKKSMSITLTDLHRSNIHCKGPQGN